MAARICGHSCKGNGSSSALNLPSSTFSRFIFLFEDFDKLFEPLILSDHFMPALDAPFLTPFIAKYTKQDLQHIFKIVLKAQAFILAFITFPEDSKERFFKDCFSDVYYEKNYLDCYNFC